MQLSLEPEVMETLKTRKRVFSFDHAEFPGLDDIDNEKDFDNLKRRSGVSTLASINEEKLHEPKICDDLITTQNEFEKFMNFKEREITRCRRISSCSDIFDAPVLLLHWKLNKPSFFEMKQKPFSDDSEDSMEDWEYLSNPCHYELDNSQKLFIQKFYPEYAEKDPYSVMNWLHTKSS